MEDFFISYNSADKLWASGIGDWLDQAGYTTIVQDRDFVAGSNFPSKMHAALQTAERVLLVLSPDFLQAKFPEAEWTAAFANDPTGERRKIIPVRVRDCRPDGLLKAIVYIDLVGLSAEAAKERLLTEVKAAIVGKRKRPGRNPAIPIEIKQAPQDSGRGTINQTATGRRIIQVAGNVYNTPPKENIVIPRRPDAISAEQEWQIDAWIEKLVELTTNKSRDAAFGMWGARFKNKFKVKKREALSVAKFPEAEAWYRQQAAILTRKLKTKVPGMYRNGRYGSIHQAIAAMGVDKLDYYKQAAARLKMQPFESLKELTKANLERVYTMALRDARQ